MCTYWSNQKTQYNFQRILTTTSSTSNLVFNNVDCTWNFYSRVDNSLLGVRERFFDRDSTKRDKKKYLFVFTDDKYTKNMRNEVKEVRTSLLSSWSTLAVKFKLTIIIILPIIMYSSLVLPPRPTWNCCRLKKTSVSGHSWEHHSPFEKKASWGTQETPGHRCHHNGTLQENDTSGGPCECKLPELVNHNANHICYRKP